MDLFKEVLPFLDKGDYKKVLELSEKDLKELSPFVLMKFMSGVKDKSLSEYHILAINEVVNKNFWKLTDYKDLQIMLLTLCGSGKKQYHYFPGKNVTEGKLFKQLRNWYPTWKDDEIEMFIGLNSKEDLIQLALNHGLQDKELKEFKKGLD